MTACRKRFFCSISHINNSYVTESRNSFLGNERVFFAAKEDTDKRTKK